MEPIAWKYDIAAYADHGPENGVVMNKRELSSAIPAEKVTWTPLYDIGAAPRGVSAEADFERMTWTFEIEQGCRVAAGAYALVLLTPNVEVTGRASAACEGPR